MDLSLGVVWYRVPDENHNDDGKHIRYLEETPTNLTRFRSGDPALYDSLSEIIKSGKRDVSIIQEFNVLPTNTVFYETPLSYEGMSNTN